MIFLFALGASAVRAAETIDKDEQLIDRIREMIQDIQHDNLRESIDFVAYNAMRVADSFYWLSLAVVTLLVALLYLKLREQERMERRFQCAIEYRQIPLKMIGN